MLTLSTTIVIRVPKELKDELVKLGIDYAEEVRKLLEEIVRRGKREEAIEALRRFRTSIGEVKGNVSAEMIREGRENTEKVRARCFSDQIAKKVNYFVEPSHVLALCHNQVPLCTKP